MQVDADRIIRLATAATVFGVAGIAAVVSYSHIREVSLEHGQTRLDADLLPLSLDGLILTASLAMLFASRNRVPVPFLARSMLALSIGGTIAVNALFGISHGWLGAVLSSWPGISFIGSVELLLWVVRVTAGKPSRTRRSMSAARDWGRRNGYDVADRGRLPGQVAEAYEARETTDSAASEREESETVTSNGHVTKEIVLVDSEQR